jgi:hypothetical protein
MSSKSRDDPPVWLQLRDRALFSVSASPVPEFKRIPRFDHDVQTDFAIVLVIITTRREFVVGQQLG